MNIECIAVDLFLRHTGTDGTSYVRDHRTINSANTLKSYQDAAAAENERQEKGKPRLAKVEQITKEQYLKERK